MATTTTIFGWPVPELTDSPNAPQQFSDLADAIETTVNRTVTIGVPASNVSLTNSAWTTICTVGATVLAGAQSVEIVGWAKISQSTNSNAYCALQVLVDGTHVFGTGSTHFTGVANDLLVLTTARRSVGLTSGAHTITLQAGIDGVAMGSLSALKTETLNSQAIAVTGIEVAY